jgi:D-glycero-D-manno-heptose 1,7-bisphosphate phosphatase
MSTDNQRLLILDRDGTINVDHGFVHRWEDWQFIPGVLDALQRMAQAGYLLLIVTNQSGIGCGYYTEDAVLELHRRVDAELRRNNINIAAYLYCPHARDSSCTCRKPSPQLVLDFVHQHKLLVDWGNSWTVGDKPADVEMGIRLTTNTVLLSSRYWSRDTLSVRPTLIANSLSEAVAAIFGSRTGP